MVEVADTSLSPREQITVDLKEKGYVVVEYRIPGTEPKKHKNHLLPGLLIAVENPQEDIKAWSRPKNYKEIFLGPVDSNPFQGRYLVYDPKLIRAIELRVPEEYRAQQTTDWNALGITRIPTDRPGHFVGVSTIPQTPEAPVK